jgi:hypothetical protein
MAKSDFETLVVLCALIALVNAAVVPNPEQALEGRDFDCSGKRGLEARNVQVGMEDVCVCSDFG